jgi:hypothetical protein
MRRAVYDALGNLTVKATSKYTYAGTANADAPTHIATAPQPLASDTTTTEIHELWNFSFSWDYKKRLTQAVTNNSTTTYTLIL